MSSLTGLSPNNPTKYLGPNVALPIIVTVPREPTGADIKQPSTGKYYSFGTFWLVGKNPTTGLQGDLWFLSKIENNTSFWVKLSSGEEAGVLEIGIPDEVPISPDVNGLINFTSTEETIEITAVRDGTGAQNINFDIALYDKESFEPVLSLATPGTSSFTYASQLGEWTSIANMVCFTMRVQLSGLTIGTGSGNVQIGPLPFPSGASFNTVFSCTLQNITFDVGAYWYSGLLQPSSTVITFPGLRTGTGQAILPATALKADSVILVSGVYFKS